MIFDVELSVSTARGLMPDQADNTSSLRIRNS